MLGEGGGGNTLAVPCHVHDELQLIGCTLGVVHIGDAGFALTTQENDYATQSMLKWFVDEQVEEEENAQNIIDNLRMIKDNGYGIYMLDKELGARVYTQAAPLANKA